LSDIKPLGEAKDWLHCGVILEEWRVGVEVHVLGPGSVKVLSEVRCGDNVGVEEAR
jgi:hypothetical protein